MTEYACPVVLRHEEVRWVAEAGSLSSVSIWRM